MSALYVFLGGGLGALVRYGIGKFFPFSGNGFPIGTFLANVISCLILGYLMGILLGKSLDQKYQLLLMTGFCGGFSTFSTFSMESYRLMSNGASLTSLFYILASVVVCIVCIWIGIKISGH